jgi:hypothetical protein
MSVPPGYSFVSNAKATRIERRAAGNPTMSDRATVKRITHSLYDLGNADAAIRVCVAHLATGGRGDAQRHVHHRQQLIDCVLVVIATVPHALAHFVGETGINKTHEAWRAGALVAASAQLEGRHRIRRWSVGRCRRRGLQCRRTWNARRRICRRGGQVFGPPLPKRKYARGR